MYVLWVIGISCGLHSILCGLMDSLVQMSNNRFCAMPVLCEVRPHAVVNRPPSGAKRRRAVQERRRAVEIHECCVSISN